MQHNYIVSFTNINSAKHWIGIVTDLVATFFIGGAAYFGVLSKTVNYVDNPGIVSLALTWSFQIAMISSFALNVISDTENIMNSL